MPMRLSRRSKPARVKRAKARFTLRDMLMQPGVHWTMADSDAFDEDDFDLEVRKCA